MKPSNGSGPRLIVAMWTLVIACTVGFVFAVVVIWELDQYSSALMAHRIDERLKALDSGLETEVDNLYRTAGLVAEVYAKDPRVIDSLARGDSRTLLELTEPFARTAQAIGGIDLIWFTRLADRTPDGFTPILACPSNRAFNGYSGLRYASTNDALDSGVSSASWESNDEDGKFQLSVPIFENERVIGAVVVGKQTYRGMLEGIIAGLHTDLSLFLKNSDGDLYVMSDTGTDAIGAALLSYSHERNEGNMLALEQASREDSDIAAFRSYVIGLLHGDAERTGSIALHFLTLRSVEYALYSHILRDSHDIPVGILVARFSDLPATRDDIRRRAGTMQLFAGLLAVMFVLGCALLGVRAVQGVRAKETALLDLKSRLENEVEERTGSLSRVLDDLRNTQQQLIGSERLAAIGQLVAGMAHEINGPIGIALTSSSFLNIKTKDVANKYRDGFLKQADFERFLSDLQVNGELIERNINRAADIFQNFRTMAIDYAADDERPIELCGHLREILESYQPMLREKGISFAFECGSEILVSCRPATLSRIAGNLISNCIDHAFEGIDAPRIELSVNKRDSGVIITVEDNGNGLQENLRSRIFEPFFTTKRGEGRIGLGLHVVYLLVHEHFGGSVQCETIKSGGLRFTVFLPGAGLTAAESKPAESG